MLLCFICPAQGLATQWFTHAAMKAQWTSVAGQDRAQYVLCSHATGISHISHPLPAWTCALPARTCASCADMLCASRMRARQGQGSDIDMWFIRASESRGA